ncbi:glutathione S-transferase [Marchantia polymorpha subsp. ruderalis]|uniref:glutathione transferase n=2 Tax=Marchantia polymorpha TaxID=3197 RepID=A0A176VP78_MARPO|nr:hypothetical protein AXG93_2035s1010 [Marchantia polymorpha subsp. ruderalis]PTQ49285.1 hypothetical protein MARPO_0003s0168 [Marchantia polymorpha]BBN17050.1 hypothetical protein Mp_7g11560 [Marchantia polymorpha subsp. ruderalis]|eukprot:PTQ49285.1 hypothetical protein MARPO_0003s0168 [Marchantia polymorpha]
MTFQVHGTAPSTCTGRVLIALYEKNVEDFQIVEVDLMKGEHKSPEFLKNQPFGQIPFIVDGDVQLFESRAICRYVAHKYADQGTPLYGATAADAALTEQWLEVEAQNYNGPIAALVFNLVFAPMFGAPRDDAVVAAQTAKLEAVLDVYEQRLSESKFLAGDFFSLADLAHMTYTHYLINMAHQGAMFDSRPHVKAWVAELFARPSYQKWLALPGHLH